MKLSLASRSVALIGKSFLASIIIFFFFITLVLNFSVKGEQHFSLLANSFIHGKTFFLKIPDHWQDVGLFNNRFYWPLGPFPAVLLMPFVFIFGLVSKIFYQGYLHFFLILGVFHLIYKISRKLKFSYFDSLYLGFAFCFSSVFLGVALRSWSWYFAQVVTTLLLILSITEFFGKRRFWFIGLLMALVLATRVSAALGTVFFFLMVIFGHKKPFLDRLKNIGKLLVPVLITLVLLAYYNYIRFGNFLEQGYSYQILPEFLQKTRDHGIFSLVHLPGNLYYFLLAMPLPVFEKDGSQVLRFPYVMANEQGMSMFITSPYLFYLFTLKFKDKISKLLFLTVFVIALPIFLYYGVGFRQLGFRYALDFWPFLFFLLIRSYRLKFKDLSTTFKALILISAFTNLYLFLTLWNSEI